MWGVKIKEFKTKQQFENFCVGSIGQEVGVFTGIKTEYFKYEDLKFHSDWNWLMEVVEKIESIKGTQIFINGISCEIMFKGRENRKNINTKIEAVYNACLEFIKWYNEQKSKKKKKKQKEE